MLGNLLKPGWQHPDKAKRLKAIQGLNSTREDDRQALCTLILEDSEKEVQLSAIENLNDASTLLKIAAKISKETEDAHCAQLKKVIASLSLVEIEKLLDANRQNTLARQITIQCYPDNNVRSKLLDDLPIDELVEVIGDTEYSETRASIAHKIENESTLEIARKILKGKDKQAERIVREKLEAIRTERKTQEESNEIAKETIEQLRFLAKHDDWRAEFGSRYQQASSRFGNLPRQAPAELQSEFSELSKIIEARIQHQAETEDAIKNQQAIIAELEELHLSMSDLSASDLGRKTNELSSQLDNLEIRWHECTASHSAIAADTQRYAKADERSHQYRQLAQEISGLSWLDSFSKQEMVDTTEISAIKGILKAYGKLDCSAITELQSLLADLESTQKERQRAYAKKLKQLHQRISRLLGTTKSGNLKIARKELAATKTASELFTGNDQKELNDRLAQAEEAVTKLADWHNFATTPKFIKLCEDMESLQGDASKKKLHPDHLAQKINDLQSKWKNIGYCADDSLWDRFKAAADSAYEPCAEFFAERNKARLNNLEKREPFIQAIKEMLDQDEWQTDEQFKQAEKKLSQIHSGWQGVKNVDRAKGKKQWDVYRKLRNKVFERLDVAYDKNLQLKQTLTAQAEKLALSEASEANLASLQSLQSRWKEVGITRRKQDQEQWKSFKAHCDAAYNNLKSHRQDKRDAFEAMLAEHRRIIDAIYDLSKRDQAADAVLEALDEEFNALPMLPKDFPDKKWEHTKAQLSKAKQAYARSKQRQEKQAASQLQEKIRLKAQLCAELERLHTQQVPNEADISDIEAQLEGIQLTDKSIEKLFRTRVEKAANADRSEFDESRRLLCVRMEIAANADTPESDRALRTNLQLERMSQKGLAAAQQGRNLSELKLQWMSNPGASPELEASLQARVDKL